MNNINTPLLAKYNKKEGCMYCPKCKSFEVMCDGTGIYKIPIGFGFIPGDIKFSISSWRLKGYIGQCELCKRRVFNYTSKRKSINYPRSINKKIAI